MKHVRTIGLHRSRFAVFGASLCGVVGLATACAGETQPLNSVADGPTGGSGGSAGEEGTGTTQAVSSANTTGSGGTGGSSGGSGGSSSAGGAGGGPGSGGSGGTSSAGGSGSLPDRDVLAEKLDILFVVDNSISIAPKQHYLAPAAAALLERLANPRCVDGDDPALAEGCPDGQQREFAPIADMHVGVISSSLGGHGGDLCSDFGAGVESYNATKNDAGKLMPSVREGLTSYQDQGFLAWDLADDEAEDDLGTLKTAVSEQILSAGETGCGLEAPLEAMYRFLIDPSPPTEVVVVDDVARPATDAAGNVLIDTELLEQRAHFLRPDSALAVVLLTDEDDCSIQDSGIGWITSSASYQGNNFTMPAATQACEADPNDPCCRSCGLIEETPPGCVPQSEDPNCEAGRAVGTDALNLRCFDQKRRFGLDLLYPVDRYVAGLTQTQIEDPWSCDDEECPLVRNPLFPPEDPENTFTRRASEVFFMSIVGVPWQDLATPESLTGDGLTYKSWHSNDDWSLMIGDPSNYVRAEDPLMVESVDPRSGTHPITGEPVAPAGSNDPTENSINGHEFINNDDSQLQYACIFPLESPKDCADPSQYSCDCTEHDLAKNRPLCQPPGGGEATTTQYSAAAHPGLRVLELTSMLPRGVPASICPKVAEGDQGSWAYGYNPAMRALLHEMSSVLK